MSIQLFFFPFLFPRFNCSVDFKVIIIIFSFESFSHQCYLLALHWSLGDCKYIQVSRNLLSILAVHNNAVVWMVYTRPLISTSSNPCISPLVTVSSAPFTISLSLSCSIVSFSSLARFRYLSLFSLSFRFIVHYLAGYIFLFSSFFYIVVDYL